MRFFLLFLSFFASVFSDQFDPYVLSSMTNCHEAFVNDTNVITGDYYKRFAVTVRGAQPIEFDFSYLSRLSQRDFGWNGSMQHGLISYFIGGTPMPVSAPEKNGMHIRYLFSHKSGRYFVYTPDPACFREGIGFVPIRDFTGKFHPKNNRLEIEESFKHIKVFRPDGSTTVYEQFSAIEVETFFKGKMTSGYDFRLSYEVLPNGNHLRYSWNKWGFLHSIFASNPDTRMCYGSLSFHYQWYKIKPKTDDKKEKKKLKPLKLLKEIDMVGSDGQVAKLFFEKRKQRDGSFFSILNKVFIPGQTDESFKYDNLKRPERGTMIDWDGSPDGRIREVSYHANKAHRFKVALLRSPVGEDGKLYDEFRFFYHGDKDGHTDVIDVYGNLTRYKYKNLRLTGVERYEGTERLQNAERLIWGRGSEENTSLLACKIFFDENYCPVLVRRFNYDDRGNLVEELLYGNFSGHSAPLVVDEAGSVCDQGVECYAIYRIFDGKNRLIEERNPEGLVARYCYDPERMLLVKKFLCDGEVIKKRFFYEYLDGNILHREVVDDGSSENSGDLSDVTRRFVTVYYPKKQDPYPGMAEVIEKRAYDLEKKEERLISKTCLEYGDGGRVKRRDIYDAEGHYCYSLHCRYDEQGRLVEETDALGRHAFYGYDGNHNCVFHKSFGQSKEFHHRFDHSNRLIEQEECGNGLTHRSGFRYDKKHHCIASTDYLGNVTRYCPNLFGKNTSVVSPVVMDEDGREVTIEERFAYDGMGRMLCEEDARGNKKCYTYNAYGKPLLITYPDGGQERFCYYLNGSLREHVDVLGTTSKFFYDVWQREVRKEVYSSGGELLSREEKGYDAFSLLWEKDQGGYLTKYSYDFAGRQVGICREEEASEVIFDGLSRPYKIVQLCGDNTLVSVEERDYLDRVLEERMEDLDARVLSRVSYQYDEQGNVTCKTHFVGDHEAKELYEYDIFNRLLRFCDPMGNETVSEYRECQSDAFGQRFLQKVTRDPLMRLHIESFDALERKVIDEKQNSAGKQISLEKMFYDLGGNLARQESLVIGGEDSRNYYTLWDYDGMNRLRCLTQAAFSQDEQKTLYDYDVKGQLVKTLKADGIAINYEYDGLGRNISLFSSDGSVSYRLIYDSLGYLVESCDRILGLSIKRLVDHRGRVLQEFLPAGSVSREFDIRGRQTKLILPDRSSIVYEYGPLHLRRVHRYDRYGTLCYSHGFVRYDLDGHLLEEAPAFALGSVHYRHDLLGRKVQHESPYLQAHIDEFDGVGNILAQTIHGQTCRYAYDDLDQLIDETGHFVHNYRFDSHCSRLQKDDELVDVNFLHQDTTHYTFDRRGNPLTKKTSEGTLYFTYDALDRLVQVSLPGIRNLYFSYDSFHRRLTQQSSSWHLCSTRVDFLYDEQNEIGCVDAGGNLKELRVLGRTAQAEIGASLVLEIRGKCYVPFHDLNGNITALVSENKKLVEKYLYSAYGEEKTVNNSDYPLKKATSPWRFSSKRTDESSLVYFGRRYYDPDTGRWLTPDPKGFTDSLNLYAFVQNNALIHIDLYGLIRNPNIDPNIYHVPLEQRASFIHKESISPESALPWEKPAAFKLDGSNPYENMNVKGYSNRAIFFMHGMKNSFDDVRGHVESICRIGNIENVIGVYNPSRGFGGDLMKCRKHLNLISTPEVDALHSAWNTYFKQNPEGEILQICHSGGSAVVHLALLRLEEHLAKKVSVLSVAPSLPIERGLGKNALNLVSKFSDFVPSLHKGYGTMRQAAKNSDIEYLTRHPEAKSRDHDFQSPTYQEKIRGSIEEFLFNKGLNE